MKYIEELSPGDIISIKNQLFLLTVDHKQTGRRLGYSLNSGTPQWFEGNDIIDTVELYRIDENNNVTPIKIIYHPPSNIS